MGEDAIIVAIVFGSILGMITIPMLISLAKKWIERNNTSYDEEKIDRLAQAFMSYKKESQRRLQNLEAIIADEDDLASRSQTDETSNQVEAPSQSIEVEEPESKKEKTQSENGNNLRNMLRE